MAFCCVRVARRGLADRVEGDAFLMLFLHFALGADVDPVLQVLWRLPVAYAGVVASADRSGPMREGMQGGSPCPRNAFRAHIYIYYNN